MLKINMEYRKGILFIRLNGNLNANTVTKFKEYTLPVIRDYGIRFIVYNLNNLTCIDQSGEEALLEESEYATNNEGKVLIVNNSINSNLDFDKVSNELVALDMIKV